ncbi:MAG TPA: cation diffusion facilitator family transporter [Jiangellales bacterium]|nr:cation diffusion facilitator family transporter [Jiangellales bacterium]
MSAGHGHGHAGARHRWRLAVAFVLITVFFAVELVAALASGSLALLSDAGHMAADVVALGAALAATRIATRPDRTGRRTFGSYRAEVFASGLAVLLMLGVAVYVLIEALRRIGSVPEVASGAMLLVGGLGFGVNAAALALLRGGARESLNVKGAYLEVVADTAGSLGVIVAGLLVVVTDEARWDTVVAVAIAVFVAGRAIWLGREVLAVLAQHVPAGMDPAAVEHDLRELPGVADVHDLHLWTLTSGMNVATAHLVTADDDATHPVLDAARDVLRDRHGVAHATLQVEPRSHTGCHEIDW